MLYKRVWVNASIAALVMAALLGLLLRSKIIFYIPFLNYNRLAEAHSRFNFSGWVTFALMLLMINELLPQRYYRKKVYDWLLGSVAGLSWCMLILFLLKGYNAFSIATGIVFILTTYVFSCVFISDVLKSGLDKSVSLLAISSAICLVLSSFGLFVIDYIYFTNSFQSLAFLYRDSLFTYLHFQYNGFFSLAILALFFNEMGKTGTRSGIKGIDHFVLTLLLSLVPSLFLSYLWQDPNTIYRVVALVGSILTLMSCFLFIRAGWSFYSNLMKERPAIRGLLILSLFSFILKLFLQSLTIFRVVGNAIFGNRPIIMGFLHLVLLGFVSLFIIAFYAKRQLLAPQTKVAPFAMICFAGGVIVNEVLLISQGLTTIFGPAADLFLWLLWAAAIWLLTGSVLIAFARIQTKQTHQSENNSISRHHSFS